MVAGIANLDELDREIARLEAALAARKRQRADRDEAAVLLMLAQAIPRNAVFSAADVFAHAAVDRELAAVLRSRSVRQLGRCLRRWAGRDVGAGLVLEYVMREERGCLYCFR